MKRATKLWIAAPLLLLLLGATASLWAGTDQTVKTHTVGIFEIGEGNYRVFPGELPVSNADPVIFNNHTMLVAQIMVPNRSFLGAEGKIIDVPPGGSVSLKIGSYQGAAGIFPYQVYLGGMVWLEGDALNLWKESGGITPPSYFGVGNSPPRMIVQGN